MDAEAALLALVHASPDDDGPRAVLADHWLERGDPRGELVVLQLKEARGEATEADLKRSRAILREHDDVWFGHIRKTTKNRVIRRGFLESIELLNNAVATEETWHAATLEPCVATLRTIHKGLGNETHYKDFVFSPALRALREVTAVSPRMLAAMVARPEPWPIKRLCLSFQPNAKAVAAIGASTSFPALEELALGVKKNGVDALVDLVAKTPELARLRCVGLTPIAWYQNLAPLGEWLCALEGTLAPLQALDVSFARGFIHDRLIVRRGESGLRLEIEGTNVFFAQDILAGLPALEHLSLRLPDGVTEPYSYSVAAAKVIVETIPAREIVVDAGWQKAIASVEAR